MQILSIHEHIDWDEQPCEPLTHSILEHGDPDCRDGHAHILTDLRKGVGVPEVLFVGDVDHPGVDRALQTGSEWEGDQAQALRLESAQWIKSEGKCVHDVAVDY